MMWFHNARTGGEFSRLVYGDESVAYYPAAEAIRQDGLSFFLSDESLRTGPLNPIWIAAMAGRIALIKVANVVLFIAAGLALWDMTRRLFDHRAGLIAVVFYAFYPPFYKFTPTLLTEPLFVPLVVLALWSTVLEERYGAKAILASGALLGLATLTRPTIQFLPLFLFGVWLVARALTSAKKTIDIQIDLRKIVLIAVAFGAIVGPYAVKNLIALDKVGLANGSGAVLYIGNDLRTHGFEPIDSQLKFNTREITAPYSHLDTEGDSLLLHAALEQIADDPIEIALLQPSKALRLVFGSPGHYFRPQDNAIDFFTERGWIDWANLLELAITPFLVILGLAGLIAIRTPGFVRFICGSFVAYMIIVNTLLFPIPRMMLAAFPVLMVFAAGALSQLPKRVTRSSIAFSVVVVLFIALKGVTGNPGIVSERYVDYFDPIVDLQTDYWLTTKDVVANPDGSITAAGPDPFLVFDITDFEATRNQMIFVTIRADGPSTDPNGSHAQVFWRTDDQEFVELQSEVFTLTVDGEFHTYAISPSLRGPWSGLISEIRLDLPDHQSNGLYELDGIDIRK